MADTHIESLERLTKQLCKLPGIGPRGAERIAFHLLRASKDDAYALADAVRDIKDKVHHCSVCYNLTEVDPCAICTDPRRDHSIIVVVEQPKDVIQLESAGVREGVYHVLMGHIAPLDGMEAGDLTIDALVDRVREGDVREIVLATNPTLEGDGTALHIHSLMQDLGVTVTRLARGLPIGSQIEYASKAMLESAVRGRIPM